MKRSRWTHSFFVHSIGESKEERKRGRQIVEKRKRERESRTRSSVPVQKMNTEKECKVCKEWNYERYEHKKEYVRSPPAECRHAHGQMDRWTCGHSERKKRKRVRGLDSQRHHSNSPLEACLGRDRDIT